jgi:predicted acetyltransferase
METSYEPISQEEFYRVYRSSLVEKRLRSQVEELKLTQLFDPYGLFVGDKLRLVIGETVVTGTVRGQERQFLVVGQAIVPPEYRRQGTLRAAVSDIVNSCERRGIPFAILRENKDGFYRQYGVKPVVDRRTWQCQPTELLSVIDQPTGEFHEVRSEDWEQLRDVHTRYLDQFSLTLQRTETHWRWILSDDFGESYRTAVWKKEGVPRGYIVYDVDGNQLVEVDSGYVDTEALYHILYYLGLHEPECETVVFEGPDRGRVFDLVGGNAECRVSPEVCLMVIDVASALACIATPPTDPVLVSVSRQFDPGTKEKFEIKSNGELKRRSTVSDPDVSLDSGTLAQLAAGYRSPSELTKFGAVQFHTKHGEQMFECMFPKRLPFVRDDI